MRYKGRRQSTNVEDRRGGGSKARKVGIKGGIVGIIIALVMLFLGGDPSVIFQFLDTGSQSNTTTQKNYQPSAQEQELTDFVKVVLADTEDVWHKIFKENGAKYQEPVLVLFNQSTQSACGYSSAATGPFYCPGDYKLYLDLNFLQQLQRKLGAKGDFAVAYIIAHEVGHHIQNLMGTLSKVSQMRGKVSKDVHRKMNIDVELQADFYAGVWAHHAQKMKNILESGDLEEAFNAAEAVGDDRIQMKSQGYVVPDNFTHGTSAQRKQWFKKGFTTGDIRQGNTFDN